jgi:hypothetical protein
MWVPNNGTTVTLSLCASSSLASNIRDSALYIRNTCNDPGGGNQLACGDDNCGGSPATRYLSEVTVTLNRGLYYVFVDGYYQPSPEIHTCGEFYLDVTGL